MLQTGKAREKHRETGFVINVALPWVYPRQGFVFPSSKPMIKRGRYFQLPQSNVCLAVYAGGRPYCRNSG